MLLPKTKQKSFNSVIYVIELNSEVESAHYWSQVVISRDFTLNQVKLYKSDFISNRPWSVSADLKHCRHKHITQATWRWKQKYTWKDRQYVDIVSQFGLIMRPLNTAYWSLHPYIISVQVVQLLFTKCLVPKTQFKHRDQTEGKHPKSESAVTNYQPKIWHVQVYKPWNTSSFKIKYIIYLCVFLVWECVCHLLKRGIRVSCLNIVISKLWPTRTADLICLCVTIFSHFGCHLVIKMTQCLLSSRLKTTVVAAWLFYHSAWMRVFKDNKRVISVSWAHTARFEQTCWIRAIVYGEANTPNVFLTARSNTQHDASQSSLTESSLLQPEEWLNNSLPLPDLQLEASICVCVCTHTGVVRAASLVNARLIP